MPSGPFCSISLLITLFLFLLPNNAWALEPQRRFEWDSTSTLEQRLAPEEGTRLTLQCPVAQQQQKPPVQFGWFVNGQPLGRHSATFSIPSVSRDDSGLYRCYAFQEQFGGAFSPGVNVSVKYMDGFMEESKQFFRRKFVPKLPFWLKSPRLRSGGHQQGDIRWRWFHAGEELISDAIRHFVAADGDLLVLEPEETAAGEYLVEASVPAKAPFSAGPYTVEKDPDALPAEPVFAIVQRPDDVKVLPDNGTPSPLAHFDCVPNLAKILEIDIQWFLNSELMTQNVAGNGGPVRFELDGRRLALSDFATLLGPNTRSAVVRCKARARTPNGGQWIDQADARLDILEMPHINRQLLGEALPTDEGESLSLVCRTDRGWPRPIRISWFFNDQKIEGTNSEQLLISQLAAHQFGVYQCEAANAAGADIAAVWVHKREMWKKLGQQGEERKMTVQQQQQQTAGHSISNLVTAASVESKAQEEPATMIDANANVIQIEEGPTNQSLLIGSNVQMPCRMQSNQKGELRPVWFRNNEEIPANGDLFRRISIEAEGTRLWIHQVGPDNIGQYRCAIRRSADGQELASQLGWLSIIEKPGMVQAVRAQLVNQSGSRQERIRVHWRPGFDGNSPVVKWSVEMRTLGAAGIWSDWEPSVELFPEQRQQQQATMAAEEQQNGGGACCSSFVENVRPAATAEFRVLAHNRFGAGKPSLPSQPVTMPQQPPAAAPTKVHASARSAQSLMVQWQPPQHQHQQQQQQQEQEAGDIRGYVVRYRLSGYSTADWNERNISDGQARNALIEPLITWREYDVQVAAYNDRGLGVFSRPVSASTLEGIPMQAPQNVRLHVLNSTAIRISFEPPNPQMVPGVNLGYKVQLWNNGTFIEPKQTVRLQPAHGRVEAEIGGLEKWGLYNLTVLCFTGPGDGPRSEPLEFRTAEDLPGPVHGLDTAEVFAESALLQWEQPKEPNGQIQKYSLGWWEEADQAGTRKTVEISGHVQNFSLEGLRPQTKYRLELQAHTSVGAGPRVEAGFESGVPPELPGRPSQLSVSEVGARKARLHFLPGSDGHAQIRRWLVEARVGQHSAVFSPLAEFPLQPRGANTLLLDSLRPHTEYQIRLIAENVRGRSLPSEPSVPFRTQPAVPEHAPLRLWADPVSAGQIALVWTPLLDWEWNGEEPRAYVLLYRGISLASLLHGGNAAAEENKNGTETAERDMEQLGIKWQELHIAGAKQHQHLLGGLLPFSLYQLRLLAQNALGRSEPGPVVQMATYEAVPTSAPAVQAQLGAQGDIEVRWQQLDPEQANGQLLGYRVRLLENGSKDQTPEESSVEEEPQPSALERQISVREKRVVHFPAALLRPNTAYTVLVQAETIVGLGPRPEQRTVLRTPEDVPDPPSNVSFIYKSANEVRLGWSTPPRPKGSILHYGVLFWRLGEPRPALPFAEVPPNLVMFSATHLRPNSTYLFALKAQSAVGWGPERVLRVSTGQKTAPLPITSPPVRDTSKAQSATELHLLLAGGGGAEVEQQQPAKHSPPRSVELQWEMAGHGRKEAEEEWKRWPELVPAEQRSITLDRLHPNTAYRLRIRFVGDLAHSAWSAPSDWLSTMEAAPSRAPADVQLEPVGPTALKVRWRPLPRQAWNAGRIGYRVQYRVYEPTSLANSAATFAMEEVGLGDGNTEKQMEVQLHGLQSFRHYLVQVRAFNVLGEGEPSRPPRFLFIGHAKPSRRVPNLRLEALSSTSIRVQWDPLLVEEGGGQQPAENASQGQINGYRIRWTPLANDHKFADHQMPNEGETADEQLTLTERTEHVLTELHKWSQYRIAVSGYNRAGEGPLASVTGRTLEDLPGPVGQLRFRHIGLDSAKVLWTAPAELNGNLTGYVLLYRTSRQRNGGQGQRQPLAELFPKKEIQLRTVGRELSLDQLEENVTYFVSVRAETAAGLGPERTAEVTTGFNAGAPEAPSRPELISEPRNVLIRWRKGPAGSAGPILGHLVQAKRIGTSAQQMLNSLQMDEKRSLLPSSSATDQLAKRADEPRGPRHIIGHWNTVGHVESPTAVEWRLPYRQMEPSSFYVFRVFARNELGIGQPSAESEQLHVPAFIPEEPFYAEWWFLALVGALLAAVIVGFVGLLFWTAGRRKEAEEKEPKAAGTAAMMMSHQPGEKRQQQKRRKAARGADAFDTLQLSDGGIASYELYAKRSERGDELLFSRPHTKQSWVGSLGGGGPGSCRNSPAAVPANRTAATGAGIGIYGSIDGSTGERTGDSKGGGGKMASQLPNMYSALATDSIPMLGSQNGSAAGDDLARNGSTHTLADRLYASRVGGGGRSSNSPPYYQLRQFNASSRLQQPPMGNNNNFDEPSAPADNYGLTANYGQLMYGQGNERAMAEGSDGFRGPSIQPRTVPTFDGHPAGSSGVDLLTAHYEQQQPERRATWRRAREQAQQQQQQQLDQRQQQQGIQLFQQQAPMRPWTPNGLFGQPTGEHQQQQQSNWMSEQQQRRSRASAPDSIEETAFDCGGQFVGSGFVFGASGTLNSNQNNNSNDINGSISQLANSQRNSNEIAGLSSFV